MSFFNNLLGTQGLSGKQKVMGGLMAALPALQHQGSGGLAGVVGGLLQGLGQARGWSQHQLPPAPSISPLTPDQIPGPVAMPSVVPPAPNMEAGTVPQWKPRQGNLGFGRFGGRMMY